MIREKKENKTEYMLEYFLSRIEHFIHFEIMKYLGTSVRTWPKLIVDIITDVNKADRIFTDARKSLTNVPSMVHQFSNAKCPEHYVAMRGTLIINVRTL